MAICVAISGCLPLRAVFAGETYRALLRQRGYLRGGIAQRRQHIPRVLADQRRRAANRSDVPFELRCRARLANTTDRWLVEFFDQPARDNLLVIDDLASAKNGRTWHVACVQSFQPIGRRVSRDVLSHRIDTCRGVHRAHRRRRESGIVAELRVASSWQKPFHSESEIVPTVMYPSLVLN